MRKKHFIEIICLLLFSVIFFTPRSFEFLPVVSMIYNKIFMMQCVVLLGAVIVSATCGFKNLKNLITLGAVIYLIFGLVIAIIHGGDYKIYIRASVHLITVLLVVSYELRRKDSCFIEFIAWYFNILLAINLVLLILKPDFMGTLLEYSEDMAHRQLDRVNFLEVDNRLSLPVLISIAAYYMLPDKKSNKCRRISSLIVGGATNILTMSGT